MTWLRCSPVVVTPYVLPLFAALTGGIAGCSSNSIPDFTLQSELTLFDYQQKKLVNDWLGIHIFFSPPPLPLARWMLHCPGFFERVYGSNLVGDVFYVARKISVQQRMNERFLMDSNNFCRDAFVYLCWICQHSFEFDGECVNKLGRIFDSCRKINTSFHHLQIHMAPASSNWICAAANEMLAREFLFLLLFYFRELRLTSWKGIMFDNRIHIGYPLFFLFFFSFLSFPFQFVGGYGISSNINREIFKDYWQIFIFIRSRHFISGNRHLHEREPNIYIYIYRYLYLSTKPAFFSSNFFKPDLCHKTWEWKGDLWVFGKLFAYFSWINALQDLEKLWYCSIYHRWYVDTVWCRKFVY